MTEQDLEIQNLRRELANCKKLLELAKQDLKSMALSNTHGCFCKKWNQCYYKCSNDCIEWKWRYENEIP